METIEWAWQHVRCAHGPYAGGFGHINDSRLLIALIESGLDPQIGNRLGGSIDHDVQDALVAAYPDQPPLNAAELRDPSPAMLKHIRRHAHAITWTPARKIDSRIAEMLAPHATPNTLRRLRITGSLNYPKWRSLLSGDSRDALPLAVRDDITSEEQLSALSACVLWEIVALTSPTVTTETLRTLMRRRGLYYPKNGWQLDISADKIAVIADHAEQHAYPGIALGVLGHPNSNITDEQTGRLVDVVHQARLDKQRRLVVGRADTVSEPWEMEDAQLPAAARQRDPALADILAGWWGAVGEIPAAVAIENMPSAPALLQECDPATVAALAGGWRGTLAELKGVCVTVATP